MARSALWVNSSTSDGAIARLASRNSSSCWNTAPSVSVDAGEIAEQADVAVLEQQPPHHLHAAEHHQIVDLRHQSAAFRQRHEVGREQHLAGLGAQPRHRLVVADLALRQRHDRLQIEVDAIGIDGAADHRQPFLVRRSWWRRPRRRSLARLAASVRGRERPRPALSASATGSGRCPPPASAAARPQAAPVPATPALRRIDAAIAGAAAAALASSSNRASWVATVSASCRTRVPSSLISTRERIDGGAGALLRAFHPAFDAREPAADLVHLARQLEIAARQFAELAADRGAHAQPGRERCCRARSAVRTASATMIASVPEKPKPR